jgi:hypothetical protein
LTRGRRRARANKLVIEAGADAAIPGDRIFDVGFGILSDE